MSNAKIEIKKNAVEQKLNEMILRGGHAQGGMARIYSLYQKLQTDRFESENSSEGAHWTELNAVYARYKLRRYGGGPRMRRTSAHPDLGNWNTYPGAGSKMMIGTGMLAGAVIGPGSPFSGVSNHRALFTDNSMTIRVEESGKNPDGSSFNYAQYAAEERPFFEFSRGSISKMKDELSKFILGF